MVVVSQAPVAFCGKLTVVTGTAQQIFQVSSAGVTAGLTAGNLYLDSPSSNLLNGRVFRVRASGWVKAHGATQTIAPEFQVFPWNTSVAGAKTSSGTDSCTAVGSAVLIAGTTYGFAIEQEFYGDSTSGVISAYTPLVSVASANIAVTTAMSPLTASYKTASQTEPGTGLSEVGDQNYPLASFVVSFANSVGDTTETAQLTSFVLEM